MSLTIYLPHTLLLLCERSVHALLLLPHTFVECLARARTRRSVRSVAPNRLSSRICIFCSHHPRSPNNSPLIRPQPPPGLRCQREQLRFGGQRRVDIGEARNYIVLKISPVSEVSSPIERVALAQEAVIYVLQRLRDAVHNPEEHAVLNRPAMHVQEGSCSESSEEEEGRRRGDRGGRRSHPPP